MDTAQALDLLLGLTASGCLVFLLYGAWLCVSVRFRAPDGAPRSTSPRHGETSGRSAIQH